jgi:hypothetical protein
MTPNRYLRTLAASPEGLSAAVTGGWLAAAAAYCYVHGYLALDGRPDLGLSLTWSLRSWGAWLLLAPVLIGLWRRPGVRIPARVVTVLAALALSAIIRLALDPKGGGASPWLAETYRFVPQSAALLIVVAAAEILRRYRLPPEPKPAPAPASPRFEIDAGGIVVPAADIRWVRACGNYVELSDGQRLLRLRSTLSDFEARLQGSRFHRIHRSFLVNLDFVDRIERIPGSRQSRVRLRGDARAIPASRRGLAGLRLRWISAGEAEK